MNVDTEALRMDSVEFVDFNVDFVRDRSELVFLLREAAEFEHTVMCSYLYAMLTLKRSLDEGVTPLELEAIERWRQQFRIVAVEEMLHLTLVNNLLSALGATANFGRPDFPVGVGRFPADYEFTLSPFNESTIRHFVYIERPLNADVRDGQTFSHKERYFREIRTDLFSPTQSDYETQGHLYSSILFSLKRMAEKFGEQALFAGRGDAQMSEDQFALPGLAVVTDLASAQAAIEKIVLQGEGAPSHSEDSHYFRFHAVAEEFLQLKAARPAFEPGRLAATNPMLTGSIRQKHSTYITHPLAMRVVDLGNCVYSLMLATLAQAAAPYAQSVAMQTGLARIGTSLMYALTALGTAATSLPLKATGGGRRAGLTFELAGPPVVLLQRCAAQLLAERASELEAAVRTLEQELALPGVANHLQRSAQKLLELQRLWDQTAAATLGAPAVTPPTAPANARVRVRSPAPAVGLPAETAAGVGSAASAATVAMTVQVDWKRCIHSRRCAHLAPRFFPTADGGSVLQVGAEDQAELLQAALGCPSGAITFVRQDGGAPEQAPAVNVARLIENGPYLLAANLHLSGRAMGFRASLCRCGQSANKPFCDGSHASAGFVATSECAPIESPALAERDGVLAVEPVPHGPLRCSGNLEIVCGSGLAIKRVKSAMLCRCGASARKPFCDGSHAKIGFRTE